MIAAPDAPDKGLVVPVQLQYDAVEGCPTNAEFVAQVQSRGADFSGSPSTPQLRSVRVTLRREQADYSGVLQLRSDERDSDARRVRGGSCAEAAEALAIVAALALRAAPEPVADTPPPLPAPELPPPTHERPPTKAKLASPPPSTRLRALGGWGPESVTVTSGELKVSQLRTASLSGGLVLGAVPGVVLPRLDLGLMTASLVTTPQGTSYLVGGMFGVRWSYFSPSSRRDGELVTSLSGFKTGVEGCASLTYDTAGFVGLFCSGFAIGIMHLETRDEADGYRRVKDIGLGTASLDLRGRYHLGRFAHVGLSAGGEFWVSRLTAERRDGTELFRSRLFNANLQLGVGFDF